MKRTINSLSLCSVYIEMFFMSQQISSGSAFMYHDEDLNKYYIITNWHNIVGRDQITHNLLSKVGAIPNKMRVYLHKKDCLGYWENGDINLYDDMDYYEGKRWLEHPLHKDKVDVVAIPILIPQECEKYNIIEELKAHDYKQDYKAAIGDNVFITGYPLGIRVGGYFPIWKSGTIASEPDFNIDDLPLFYIDAASREGMSGSAVIVRKPRIVSLKNKGQISHWQTSLLGIYSGRIGADAFGNAVGKVWKAKVIKEIINQKILD